MNHFEAIEKLLTHGGWKPVRTAATFANTKRREIPPHWFFRYRGTRLFPKRWSGISKTLQDYPFGVSPVFSPP